MKTDNEILEEFESKYYDGETIASDSQILRKSDGMVASYDEVKDLFLTTFKEVREADRKRIRNNVKYKSIVALSNQGYQFAIAGDDLEQTLTTNN